MSDQVERITTVWDLRLDKFEDKLNKVVRAAYGSADKIEKRLDSTNDNIGRIFGKPSQALDKVFDSTRFKVLDSGIARVGIFGSALESLGPAGLAAAAGIGAFAGALAGARSAARFADDIADTAKSLGISTDALQEYRYAIRAAGGEEKGADEALQSFKETLGKAHEGLTKAQKGFLAIGFKKEQIANIKTVEEGLQLVAQKLVGLSAADRAAAVSQLGLGGLKELLDEGPDKMNRLLAEAKSIGVVMDSDLVKRGGELNDQFETLERVISIQLKSALIDLGPVLVELLKLVAGFAKSVADIVDSFKSIEHKRSAALESRKASIEQALNNPNPYNRQAQAANPKIRESLQRQLDEINGILGQREKDAAPPPVTGTRNLANLGGSGGTDRGPAQTKHFNDELARIQDRLLSAAEDDLHTLEERQAIARQRLAAEAKAHQQSIADQVRTKAITDAQGKILLAKAVEADTAKASQLVALQQLARQALQLRLEKELVDSAVGLLDARAQLTATTEQRAALEGSIFDAQRALARKVLDQALAADPDKDPAQRAIELARFDAATDFMRGARSVKTWADLADEQQKVTDSQLGAQIEAAQLQGQLTDTMKARREAELKLLELQYQEQRKRLLNIIAISNNTAEIEAAQTQLKTLDDNQAARRQGVIDSTRGPLEQFRSGLPLDPDKLNEALERVKTHGLQSLEDGLVGVITHTQKLGDVFREVAAQIIADLARIAIQRAIIGPIENVLAGGASNAGAALASLFGGHRAGGGPVSPGRIYMVGENGPEPFIPNVAGTIVPNSALRSVAGMTGAPAQVTVIQPIQQTFDGAVMTKDLLAEMKAMARQSAIFGQQTGAALALRGMPGQLAAYQQHNGG